MAWEKVKLGDVCLSISDGDHLAPPKADAGIPFVTISNIDSTNHFDFSNTMFVPIEYYEKLDEKRKPQQNDILYSVVVHLEYLFLCQKQNSLFFSAILRY